MAVDLRLTQELVALCERIEADPGPDPSERYMDDDDYARAARHLAEQLGEAPLWVFAYGSLIWKPAFSAEEHVVGTAHGWHRAFCLEIRRWRGTPQQPGLMLALRRGGSCRGVAYRLPAADRVAQIEEMLRREISRPGGLSCLRWLPVSHDGKRIRALTFWAVARDYPVVDHAPEQVARILARACGHLGSGASYLYHTVLNLDAHGIRDRYLWRLQHLVAEEIAVLNTLSRA